MLKILKLFQNSLCHICEGFWSIFKFLENITFFLVKYSNISQLNLQKKIYYNVFILSELCVILFQTIVMFQWFLYDNN